MQAGQGGFVIGREAGIEVLGHGVVGDDLRVLKGKASSPWRGQDKPRAVWSGEYAALASVSASLGCVRRVRLSNAGRAGGRGWELLEARVDGINGGGEVAKANVALSVGGGRGQRALVGVGEEGCGCAGALAALAVMAG